MTKKILIISQSEVIGVIGGAIKSFCVLVNALSKMDYQVVAACYNPEKGEPYIELEKNVKFVNLYYLNTENYVEKTHNLSLYEKIFSVIYKKRAKVYNAIDYSKKVECLVEEEKPDLMMFFFPHVLLQSTFMKKFNIPKVLLFRSRPDVYYKKITTPKKYVPLIKFASKKADYAQVLFDSYKKIAKRYVNCEVESIPNYVEMPLQQADLSSEKKTIIYASRVDNNKGQDFLIKSFARIASKYPDWQVHIYGEVQPPEFGQKLNNLTKKHKVEKQVKIFASVKDPVEKLLQSDICVFPSYFEGFPNGLAEAMSVGLPCVGLDSCSGVNELIENNESGFLCPKNEKAFAEKMSILIEDKKLRIKLGNNARESMKKYSYENFTNEWQKYIEKILGYMCGQLNQRFAIKKN